MSSNSLYREVLRGNRNVSPIRGPPTAVTPVTALAEGLKHVTFVSPQPLSIDSDSDTSFSLVAVSMSPIRPNIDNDSPCEYVRRRSSRIRKAKVAHDSPVSNEPPSIKRVRRSASRRVLFDSTNVQQDTPIKASKEKPSPASGSGLDPLPNPLRDIKSQTESRFQAIERQLLEGAEIIHDPVFGLYRPVRRPVRKIPKPEKKPARRVSPPLSPNSIQELRDYSKRASAALIEPVSPEPSPSLWRPKREILEELLSFPSYRNQIDAQDIMKGDTIPRRLRYRKRPRPTENEGAGSPTTGQQTKRRKVTPAKKDEEVPLPMSQPAKLTAKQDPPNVGRHLSESHISIMKAISDSSNKGRILTGDFSRPLALPIIEGGRHPDLPSISPDTLAKMMMGDYDDTIDSYTIYDCRYPYEYHGGHIMNAINLSHSKKVLEILTKQKVAPSVPDVSSKRRIHIFHCEFSAKRAPSALRFLREKDRSLCREQYPALHFPELYILEGGYKAFHASHSSMCFPPAYVTMNDQKHKKEYVKCRAQSKSWKNKNKQMRLTRIVTRSQTKENNGIQLE